MNWLITIIVTFLASLGIFAPAFLPPAQNIRDLKFPLSYPNGSRMGIFADLGLDMPRVLAFDPNGVLVASITNNGKVLAILPDKIVPILTGLKQPHGIVFYQDKLYVAENNQVSVFDYNSLKATNQKILFKLPAGGVHFTRTIKIQNDKLYITIGSSCNVCNESDPMRASMWTSDLDGKNLRLFASGLRNTVFFTFDKNGKIWGNDMGRDLLGDNLPPDELNIIEDQKNYGWPSCYGENICSGSVPMHYGYSAHNAPLGIVFDQDGNLLVALHGSWNSSVPVGYKIIKLTVKDDKIIKSEDFVSGFLQGSNVLGRPVDLIFDEAGNLYISDDKAGLIYILSKKK